MTGANPVFAHVNEQTFRIDPAHVEARVTLKTKAVIGVHLFGQPFDVPGIQQVCKLHNLLLIEEAAQAQGACIMEKRPGDLDNLVADLSK